MRAYNVRQKSPYPDRRGDPLGRPYFLRGHFIHPEQIVLALSEYNL